MVKSRIRSKHKSFTAQLQMLYVTYGSDEWEGWVQYVPTYRHYRTMADVVGLSSFPFNPCGHFKLKFPRCGVQYLTALSDTGDVAAAYQLAGGEQGFLPVPDWHVFVDQAITESMSGRMSGYAPRANYHMVTAIRQEVDLPSFLIELYAPLLKLKKGMEALWKNLIGVATGAAKRYWKARLGHLARGATDIDSHYLAWNFAILPTLKDMRALIKAMTVIERRLKWLRQSNGKMVRVNYRERPTFQVEFSIPLAMPDSASPGSPKDLPFSFVFTGECEVSMTSWAEAQFNIPWALLKGMPGKAAAWAVYHGILNPLGTAWEQTPFSWVIDWFRNAESKLSQKKLSLSPYPPASISGEGSTLRRRYAGTLEIVQNSDPSNRVHVGIADFTIYDRRQGSFEQFISRPTLDSLSLYQGSLLAAVASQRGRRRIKLPKRGGRRKA